VVLATADFSTAAASAPPSVEMTIHSVEGRTDNDNGNGNCNGNGNKQQQISPLRR
jgi:hypothetical protein